MGARLATLAEGLLIVAFVGMGVAIMTQICLRALGHSFLLMEDVAFFGCFWLVFSGAAVAFRDRSHVTVDLLVEYLPARVRRVVDRFAQVAVLLFLVLFIWSGVRFTIHNFQQHGMQLRISMAYIYFVLPLAGFISWIIVLSQLWRDAAGSPWKDAP